MGTAGTGTGGQINREGFYRSETERECTKCGCIFGKPKKTVTLCSSCNSERVKGESDSVKMFRRAKNRAKERGIAFDLEKSDIVIPEFCPILGIKLETYSGQSGGHYNSPALDRVNNSDGYTKGNVMVISHLANMMKSCATEAQLITFANWVHLNFEDTREIGGIN